ncbi:MAG: BatA domain-containing protein, partial [Pirellulaceae bacterium]
QPWLLVLLPLLLVPLIIHLINQWRYQTKRWGAMMFLLTANRMARGYAKLRQWLILAARMAAIAGLVFAISRPLASGLMGMAASGRPDTSIVLLDRSPSMEAKSLGGAESKLETGRRQLRQALSTIGSKRWVLVDSATDQPREFEKLEGLLESPQTEPFGASSDIPGMLQKAAAYLAANRPGPTEIWICSDLRTSDWQPDSPIWS